MRYFKLMNKNGQTWDMMANDQTDEYGPLYLNQPKGLGVERDESYRHVGDRWVLVYSDRKQQTISGTALFLQEARLPEDNKTFEPYDLYFKFIRFINVTPLTLIYQTVAGDEGRTYYRSVRVTKVEKTEKNEDGYLECPIELTAMGPWYKKVTYINDPNVKNNIGWVWEDGKSDGWLATGQYKCYSASDEATKIIEWSHATGPVIHNPITELTDDMHILFWLMHRNTVASNVMIQLEETDPKPLYYNGSPVDDMSIPLDYTQCEISYSSEDNRWNLIRITSDMSKSTWGDPDNNITGIVWGRPTTMEVRWTSDSYMDSPCRIRIEGPLKDPSWTHYLNGQVISSGKVTCEIPKTHYLVIDNSKDPYEIAEYDKDDDLIFDQYQNSDFTTDRFITLKPGLNVVVFSNQNMTTERIVKISAEAMLYYESV